MSTIPAEVSATPSPKRIHLKKVLVASDFTEVSAVAVSYTKALARAFGSELLLSHVIERAPLLAADDQSKIMNAHKADATADLLAQAAGHSAPKAIVRQGDVVTELNAIIQSEHPDLVVMGTHGGRGHDRVVFGSVAEAIFRGSAVPVLTVGPYVPKPAADDVKFKSILLPMNFSEQSLAALPYAVSLAEEFQAGLTLLCVAEPWEDELHLRRKLELLIPPEAALWCKPALEVERYGPVPKVILQTAHERKADLIVMGVRQLPGWSATALPWPWATSYSVARDANCPVLTIRK